MSEDLQTKPIQLPRVVITFCTQCKWLLRAAYYAQELLSTFGNSIGEVALAPATGGLFKVELVYEDANRIVQTADGGFPETKILKQLVRNHIDPDRKLGHSDTPSNKATVATSAAEQTHGSQQSSSGHTEDCETCKQE